MEHIDLSPDLKIIADLIPNQAKVLDIGCADGDLLAWLAAHKSVKGHGIEQSMDRVQRAISRGQSVIQANAEEDLPYYQPNAYDYIILNQILQQMRDPVAVLSQAAKVARYVIVSVPNFGHWRNRWYLAWNGKMPVTSQLDYEWYETPNIHFCTLKDFKAFAAMLHLSIEKRVILPSKLLAPVNVFAEKGIFLLKSND